MPIQKSHDPKATPAPPPTWRAKPERPDLVEGLQRVGWSNINESSVYTAKWIVSVSNLQRPKPGDPGPSRFILTAIEIAST